MTYQTPCHSQDNNPDDWFIGKDGKQYADDPMPGYSNESVLEAWAAAEDRLDRSLTEKEERRIDDMVYDDATRVQLRIRRHAREKCHSECYFRLECLGKALENPTPATHGTWGGYYEEELRAIRDEIIRRKSARSATD